MRPIVRALRWGDKDDALQQISAIAPHGVVVDATTRQNKPHSLQHTLIHLMNQTMTDLQFFDMGTKTVTGALKAKQADIIGGCSGSEVVAAQRFTTYAEVYRQSRILDSRVSLSWFSCNPLCLGGSRATDSPGQDR